MHPRLAVVHRSANDGQSAASLDGFARSCGEYVIFMDADDYLLPSAVQTHVTVHLSSRVHVGFTSVDMLQMFHERIVLSTGEAINRYISRHQDARVDLLRDAGKAMGGLDVHPALAKGVYLVPPGPSEWVWSPTSGNCFRRDALLLFLDNPQLPELRTHTDYYLNMAVSSQFGSILIDEALFVYRLHDVNVSYGKPHLNGRLAFDPTKTAANERFARLLLIDHLARHFGRFVQEPWMRSRFFRTLNCLDIRNDDVPGPRWARKSRVASRLVLSKDQMCEAFGWSSTAWAAVSRRRASLANPFTFHQGGAARLRA